MNRPPIGVPLGLIAAMDGALESGTRMRPEHICGVLDWLNAVITMNVESHVSLNVDELVLIAHALGDAMGAPIHEIDTEHVRNVLSGPTPVLVMPADKDIPTATLIAAARAAGSEVMTDDDRCPGPGKAHPTDDGSPEYYCAVCRAEIEEH